MSRFEGDLPADILDGCVIEEAYIEGPRLILHLENPMMTLYFEDGKLKEEKHV